MGTESRFQEDPELVRVDRDESSVVVRVMLTFDRAATDFLGDCERRGFTPTSLVTYDRTYRQFAEFIPRETDVSKITSDDIRRYLNTKAKLAKGTRAGIEAHLASLFSWLLKEGKIVKDPMAPIARTRRLSSEELDVVTVSTADVQRMLEAARGWSERICMGVLVYTGCRRRAASRLRLADYDQLHRRLRFREKGGKTIWKPVPDELDNLIRAAMAAGVYEKDDYLIPSMAPRPHASRANERSHRVIYDIVKRVAKRAGVRCHTHALRAAFAVYYLETHQRDTLALQSLMGHRSPATTQIYLRKLDRQAEMERVRDLSWGVAPGGDATASESPQIASKRFDEDRLVGAGGFEPPEGEDPPQQTARTEHRLAEDLKPRNQATPRERV
jgi:integrase